MGHGRLGTLCKHSDAEGDQRFEEASEHRAVLRTEWRADPVEECAVGETEQPSCKCRVCEVVGGCLPEPGKLLPDRSPRRDWIEEPELLKGIAVGDGGGAGGLVVDAGGGRVQDVGIAGGAGCGRSIGTKPIQQYCRFSDRKPLLGDIPVDGVVEVAVQFASQQAIRQAAKPRKA